MKSARLFCLGAIFAACLVFPAIAAGLQGDPFAEGSSFEAIDGVKQVPEFQIGGFAESRNQLSLRNPGRPVSLLQRVRVEGQWKKDVLTFYANLEGAYEAAAPSWPGDHSPWRGELREAYVSYDTEICDAFIGRKIHRWGTGDGINPMDLINPLDMRDPFSSGRADNRVPAWMLGLAFSRQNLSLEGIFLPKAAVMRLPEQGSPWEPEALQSLRQGRDSGRYALRTSNDPDSWFKDAEFGARLSALIQGWDLSLMFFHGFLDQPLFPADSRGPALVVEAEHPRFSAIGASFAKGFGSQTIRGEFAYKPRYPAQFDFDMDRADLWQGVIGWDYDVDGKYYLNFQCFADIYEGKRQVASTRYHGGAYEISAKWQRDALKAGVRGKLYTSGDGALTELFMEYALDDHWKLFTGLMWWAGKSNTLLGEYKGNDFVYVTLRYSF